MQQRVLGSDIRVSWVGQRKGALPARSPWRGCSRRSPGSPIQAPGKLKRLEENLGAADIELSIVEMTEIEAGAAQIENPGGRHSDTAEAIINL
jgi:aryl-alcohol dehydrogenase-like predicted oxidoreductase